ncbi:hypothetical protein P4O66_019079 [Electrophorus voltai]|uniref:Tetraspanin n=1 Tax=Electrophorus voltai TaxID=2609070 RepID=A0AAD8YRW7_9TELE|nr:CD9 antigen isoform X2 [Electrophorus electricus]KAK1785737.1 hypothetical protein P4O66_019079 [Electrophorus voltai]
MTLDGCGQMCKWILILFNVLYVLVGLLILGLGFYLRFSAEGPLNIDLKTNHFIFVVGLLMAVGAVILLTAVIGFCSENKTSLGVYSSLLTVLATAAIIAGILAYNNSHKFVDHVGEFYATVYGQYMIKKDWIRGTILKLFHNTFDCCGLGGTVQTILGETDVCPQRFSLLGLSISNSSNCLTVIVAQMQASSVLWFFLGIAGVMLFLLFCSILLYCGVKKRMYNSPLMYY